MKKLVIVLFGLIALLSCKNDPANLQEEQVSQTIKSFFSSYTSVGETFSPDSVLSVNEMDERYLQMEEGDTIRVKFKAGVNSVCKNEGCWMKLNMNSGKEAMVKFRDYAFFVPKDIENKEVIVNGKAYVTEVSVEEQRHLAEDGGKSPEEVSAIVKPKKTLSFLAEGVVIEYF